jgi:glycine dehydrogenase subunit 1
VLGKRGFREMALINLRNAHYAKEKLGRLKEFKVQKVPVFNEFVVKSSRPVSEIREALMEHDIVGGLDLAQFFPDLKDHMLFCVTERNSHKEIDRMCDILRGLA